MKLSDSKHKLTCFVIMTLFPIYKNMLQFSADLVLIKMGLCWTNFLIHLFLYAGVYCSTDCDKSSKYRQLCILRNFSQILHIT